MKSTILRFTFMAAFVMMLSSCNRWQHQYPEDTERTKLTPLERLSNKWWSLETVTINGSDITDSMKNVLGYYRMYLSSKVWGTSCCDTKIFDASIVTEKDSSYSGSWILDNSETYFTITALPARNILALAPSYYPFPINPPGYTILKMNQSNFKIYGFNLKGDTSITYSFSN